MSKLVIYPHDLKKVLEIMGSYVEDCCSLDMDITEYFNEIVESGLFHDAVGKIINKDKDSVTIIDEY